VENGRYRQEDEGQKVKEKGLTSSRDVRNTTISGVQPMKQSIYIRQADLDRKDDRDAVLHLVDVYARDAMGDGRPLTEETGRRTIDGLRSHPAGSQYVAYASEQPVGLAVCFLGFSTFAGRPLINIHDVIVHPDYRRQGIARALLEHVEMVAKQSDCCKLTLEVRCDNAPAKSAYQQHGFAPGQPAYEFWTKTL
jgi:ribosomal protein S18 acetylase RimI-like enzyme